MFAFFLIVFSLKVQNPSFYQFESSSPKNNCQIWLKLGQWSGEEGKHLKVYDDNNDNNNDDDRQRTNCDQKSSLEPSNQVS